MNTQTINSQQEPEKPKTRKMRRAYAAEERRMMRKMVKYANPIEELPDELTHEEIEQLVG